MTKTHAAQIEAILDHVRDYEEPREIFVTAERLEWASRTQNSFRSAFNRVLTRVPHDTWQHTRNIADKLDGEPWLELPVGERLERLCGALLVAGVDFEVPTP